MKRLIALTVVVLTASMTFSIAAERSNKESIKLHPKTATTERQAERTATRDDVIARRETSKSAQPATTPEVRQPQFETLTNEVDDFAPAPVERPITQSTMQSAGVIAPINLDWFSVNHGGAIEIAAGPFKMGITVGQNAADFVEAGPFQMGLGFWYGAASSTTAPCACDCHGDPICNGDIDIFDMVKAADVIFRGGPDAVDPNVLCPVSDVDVNCDNVTDIIDMVILANIAFQGGDPNTLYCNPCPGTVVVSR